MDKEFFKGAVESINMEKQMITTIISPHLSKNDLTNNAFNQKRQELVDVGKFIVASGENIFILNAPFTIPDLLIEWDNEMYGLEHTEVIDKKKKAAFERTESLVKGAEKIFLTKYGDVKKQINFSLKFEVTKIYEREKKKLLKKLNINFGGLHWDDNKLMSAGHPGYLTDKDIEIVAEKLADMAYLAFNNGEQIINNDLVNYISVRQSKKTMFTRSHGWSAGSLSEQIIQSIEEKEKNIPAYIQNTKGLKQCLFLLIQGSNGYSDYAYFDNQILKSRGSAFDKVVAFNFFKDEYFILK